MRAVGIAVLMLLCTVGCVTLPEVGPPEPEVFKAINQELYILSVNDCSNKAAKYTRVLQQAGYRATLLVIALGNDRTQTHAIVRVQDGKRTLYCDPTHHRTTELLGEWGYTIVEVPLNRAVAVSKQYGWRTDEFDEYVLKPKITPTLVEIPGAVN